MTIPKIIHQTWKDDNVPQHLQAYYQSWRTHHPDWEFKLWTDAMNRSFIEQYFPGFLRVYDSYPHPIQKVDAVRYFILLREGGVFIDLDFECLKNIETLLMHSGFVVGKEPDEHARVHQKEYILSNAFMASTPSNDFLQSICDRLQVNQYLLHRHEPGFNLILDCAGPFMLGRCYEAYIQKEEVTVVSHEYLFPLVKDYYSGKVNIQNLDTAIQEPYAVHHYWGSWWNR